MGERKVMNRYFDPSFDPSLVPKRRWDPMKQVEVRMMLPFNMQCLKCGEFMYRGKKFNSRKEDALNEDYLGVRIYRFYIKCSVCSNEIAFKTDPKNQDYVCESGASRNYESWRQQDDREAALESERQTENAMAALESRTLDSKIEMDILDALDDIKAHNQRNAAIDPSAVLKQKRLREDLHDVDDFKRQLDDISTTEPVLLGPRNDDPNNISRRRQASVTKLVAKRMRVDVPAVPPPPPATEEKSNALTGLMGGYGSSSGDDDDDNAVRPSPGKR